MVLKIYNWLRIRLEEVLKFNFKKKNSDIIHGSK